MLLPRQGLIDLVSSTLDRFGNRPLSDKHLKYRILRLAMANRPHEPLMLRNDLHHANNPHQTPNDPYVLLLREIRTSVKHLRVRVQS